MHAQSHVPTPGLGDVDVLQPHHIFRFTELVHP